MYRKLSVDTRAWPALYYLYRLFWEGGCNAVKQWGLWELPNFRSPLPGSLPTHSLSGFDCESQPDCLGNGY
jgi:hypothetical protein